MNAEHDPRTFSRGNRRLLFLVSCLAYSTIGFHFSIRSNIAGDLESLFATVDPQRAAEMVGSVLGVAFLGYGITIFVISPLIDVIGGLSGLALGALDASWKIKLAATLVPAVMLAVLCFFARFPLTERAASGISFGAMIREVFRRPMFWVWFFCIWITATAELAPGQWVDMALTRTVGIRGIWLLIYPLDLGEYDRDVSSVSH